MIVQISPDKKRHCRIAKDMFAEMCDVLDNIKKRPEGYIIMAWDARGNTCVRTEGGGAISHDLMPIHAFSVLTSLC